MIRHLNEILKHGNIEPLQFGSDVSSAVAVVGPPDGQFKFGNNDILKYGALQLFFESGLLGKVALATTNAMVLQLTNSIFEVSSKTTVEEFIDVCETLEIPWSINQSLTFDRQLCLSTNATTDVFFDLDHRELSIIQVNR